MLSVVLMKDRSRYEGLSYVWGDSELVILLNGHEFRVTKNLEAALRHLRRLQDIWTLWIDAISINQYDVHERSLQAPLMVNIYTNCRFCTAWLGEGDADNVSGGVMTPKYLLYTIRI
jgi:hypothetical protein